MKKLFLVLLLLWACVSFATVRNVKTGYGAAGDDTTDDTAAINSAIAALVDGDSLYFPTGTYKVTSALTTIDHANITVYGDPGGTSIIHGTGSSYTILQVGAGTLSHSWSLTPPFGIALSATANEGDSQFTLASMFSGGLAAGDYVILQQGGRDGANSSDDTHCDASGCRGEVVKVAAVNGNTVTVTTVLHDTYSPSVNGAGAIKFTNPTTGANLHDLAFTGSDTVTHGLYLKGAVNATVTNVSADHFTDDGLYSYFGYNNSFNTISTHASNGYDFYLYGKLAINGVSATSLNSGAFPFNLHEMADCTVDNVTSNKSGSGTGRAAKTTSTRHCSFSNWNVSNAQSSYNGLSIEYYSAHNTFTGFTLSNNSGHGIWSPGNYNQYNTFKNCTVSGSSIYQMFQGASALGQNENHHWEIDGGNFTSTSGQYAIGLTSNDAYVHGATITGPGIHGLDIAGNDACVNSNHFSGFTTDIVLSGTNNLGASNVTPDGTSGLTEGACHATPPVSEPVSLQINPGVLLGPGIRIVAARSAAQTPTLAQPIAHASNAPAFTQANTAGNLIVAIIGWNDATRSLTGVTDDAGNTYAVAAPTATGTLLRQAIYYAKNIVAYDPAAHGGVGNRVTAAWDGTPTTPDVRILEFSGLDSASPLDVYASGSGAYTGSVPAPVATATATTSAANELLVAGGLSTWAYSAPGTNFTGELAGSDLSEYRVVNAIGTYAADATISAHSQNWLLSLATFKAAGQTVGSSPAILTGIAPSSGSAAGGTAITLTGSNFAPGAVVSLGGVAAGNVTISGGSFLPTTNYAAEVNNNTSACGASNLPAYCSGAFTGSATAGGTEAQTQVPVPAPGNVSQLSLHTLAPAGTKLLAHFMPWFRASGSHTNAKYSSDSTATVAAQMSDMIGRGYDGVVVDWYGPGAVTGMTVEDNTALKLRDDLAARATSPQAGPLLFALMEDQGSWKKPHSGYASGCWSGSSWNQACVIAAWEEDLCYMNDNFLGSNAYMKLSPAAPFTFQAAGYPVTFYFPPGDTTGLDLPTVRSTVRTFGQNLSANCPAGNGGGHNNGPVTIVGQEQGAFTQAGIDGAFAWVKVLQWNPLMDCTGLTGDADALQMGSQFCLFDSNGLYLDNFYSTADANAGDIEVGSAWPGFDDYNWGAGPARVKARECGQTWIKSFHRALATATPPPFLQVATWNDYEEGTAVEPGIDNCYSLAASLAGSALNWVVNTSDPIYAPASGSLNGTVDHFEVLYGNGSGNLAKAGDDLSPALRAFDLSALPPGSWSVYVKAVGKPGILNQISAPVAFVGSSSYGTTITATTPAHAAGVVDVSVTNPGSTAAILAAGFTYVAPPTSNDRYVATTGLDTNDGSQASPWATIYYAARHVPAGGTIHVAPGTYAPTTIDCAAGATQGTAGAPITLISDSERQAFLQGNSTIVSPPNGGQDPLLMRNCNYWTIQGFRGEDGDWSTYTDSIIYLYQTDHVTLRRNLLRRPNRNWNATLIQLDHTTNSLVEENELYEFHKHAVVGYAGTNSGAGPNIFRRNYCNSREWHDLATYTTEDIDRGDQCVFVFAETNDIVENNISEDVWRAFEVRAGGTTYANNNKFYGNIAYGNVNGFVAADTQGNGDINMPHGTLFDNNVSVQVSGFADSGNGFHLESIKTTTISHSTAILAGQAWNGFRAKQGAMVGDLNYSITLSNDLAFNVGPAIAGAGVFIDSGTGTYTVSGNKVNAYNFQNNFSGTYSAITNRTTSDPQMGTCYLWRPDGSWAKTNDVGADVLYRYNNGTLTATPLWDAGGNFPQGAIVAGWNDVAGSSLYDVKARLHINTGGCAFPAGYGGGTVDHTLTVTVTGSGTVTSTPAGINACNTTCSASFPAGTSVQLAATPGSGATFQNWSGDCTGSGACSVTLDADKSVGAAFTTPPPPPTVYTVQNQQPTSYKFFPNTLITTPLPADVGSHHLSNSSAIVHCIFGGNCSAGTGGSESNAYVAIWYRKPADDTGSGNDTTFYWSKETDPLYKIMLSVDGHALHPTTATDPELYAAGKNYYHITDQAQWNHNGGCGYNCDHRLTFWDQSTDIDSTPGGRVVTNYQSGDFAIALPHCPCYDKACTDVTSACQITWKWGDIAFPQQETKPYYSWAGAYASAQFAPPALMLRQKEVVEGNVPHGLLLLTYCVQNNTPAWPANSYLKKCSNVGVSTPNHPENGMLFYIDSGFDCDTVRPWQKGTCHAMQTYGGYITATGGVGEGEGLSVNRIEQGVGQLDPAGSTLIPWINQYADNVGCTPPTGFKCGAGGLAVTTDGVTRANTSFFNMPGVLDHLHVVNPCFVKTMANRLGDSVSGACN